MATKMNPEFSELFGSMLRSSGLTQQSFAQSAGLDVTTINRCIRGKGSTPRISTLLKLINGLGLDSRGEKAVRLFETAGRRPPINLVVGEVNKPLLAERSNIVPEDHPLLAALERIETKMDRLTLIIEGRFGVEADL